MTVRGIGRTRGKSGTSSPATPPPGQVTNLANGTATSTTMPLTWTAPSGTITDYVIQYDLAPPSWYRVWVVYPGSGQFGIFLLPPSYTNGDGFQTWTGDGTNGVYVTGCMLEDNTAVSAYSATSPNILGNPENQAGGAWGPHDLVVTGGATTPPTGFSNADLIVADAVNTYHANLNTMSISATHMVMSAYFKADGHTKVALRESAVSGAFASFDLTGAGTVLATGDGATSAGISMVSDGPASPVYQIDFTAASSLGAEWTTSGGTNGTRINSSGVIVAATTPRFDFDFVTHAAKGLLLEPARTNLALHSHDLSTGDWVATGITRTDGIADPAGGTTASRLTSTAFGYIFNGQGIGSATGSTGIWVRRVSGTGTIHTWTVAGSTGNTIVPTSTWQRFFETGDTSGGAIYCGVVISAAGDVIDVAYAMSEAGAYTSSDVPTDTATITRSADSLTPAGTLATQLAAGPSVIETTSIATGVTSRTAFAAGAFVIPSGVWFRSMGVYAPGTDTSGHMTVGSPY